MFSEMEQIEDNDFIRFFFLKNSLSALFLFLLFYLCFFAATHNKPFASMEHDLRCH